MLLIVRGRSCRLSPRFAAHTRRSARAGPRERAKRTRGSETRPPAELRQVRAAGCLRPEAALELGEIPRVILHEAPTLYLGLLESSEWPPTSH
jgi:hypothetical protein